MAKIVVYRPCFTLPNRLLHPTFGHVISGPYPAAIGQALHRWGRSGAGGVGFRSRERRRPLSGPPANSFQRNTGGRRPAIAVAPLLSRAPTSTSSVQLSFGANSDRLTNSTLRQTFSLLGEIDKDSGRPDSRPSAHSTRGCLNLLHGPLEAPVLRATVLKPAACRGAGAVLAIVERGDLSAGPIEDTEAVQINAGLEEQSFRQVEPYRQAWPCWLQPSS